MKRKLKRCPNCSEEPYIVVETRGNKCPFCGTELAEEKEGEGGKDDNL